MTTVTLKPRRARPFFARHPWVFADSVGHVEGDPEPGAEVAVRSHEGTFIARGLYNPRSLIRVRLYRWEDAPLDEPFWAGRLAAAIRLRREVLPPAEDRSAGRLVFSESDGLSGLSVDRYDRWLVAQFTSLALYERRELLLRQLAEQAGAEGILLRTERGVAGLEGLELKPQHDAAVGALPDGPIAIVEHGLTYRVDPRAGQKTGFYLDQHENRRAVAGYLRGRRLLDLFCYTGAFGLAALRHGGATSVLGVDSSAPALALARENAAANGIEAARFEEGDVLPTLRRLASEGERFGAVICDPPKFARNPRAIEDALKGYLRLNRAALDVLEPDGVLVTCSCSGHVDRQLFAELLGQVAEQSGRPIQILEQRGQAADHPVSASCLETDYLKCFVCRVGERA
jgi:23S rRNA (cytosine1962-C5)-methyltransferase